MKLQVMIDFSVDGKIPKGFDMDLIAQEIVKGLNGGVNSEVKNILIKKKAKT